MSADLPDRRDVASAIRLMFSRADEPNPAAALEGLVALYRLVDERDAVDLTKAEPPPPPSEEEREECAHDWERTSLNGGGDRWEWACRRCATTEGQRMIAAAEAKAEAESPKAEPSPSGAERTAYDVLTDHVDTMSSAEASEVAMRILGRLRERGLRIVEASSAPSLPVLTDEMLDAADTAFDMGGGPGRLRRDCLRAAIESVLSGLYCESEGADDAQA